ncbi:Rap1 - C-terminal [Penicillium alfredii]|uniref:DNA-binding protein RAP1 n=1 Tax=Penicillium alfredii TaxID=1506179 RepID=A0A9W9FSR5_9EURO|nr:Rap1 - C-terminal [Penicillium alfredii]KAJ5105657.1 Rap1 - C-terminal [Penicillium alfredii]
MGASHIPRKGTRFDYSLRDDQILFDWLHPLEKEKGAPINGNKIYQEIAVQCPRHSWQSWRARYLKKLRGRPRPGGGAPLPRSEWFPDDSAQERTPEQPAPEPSMVPEPRSPRAPSPQPPKPAELKRKRDSVPEDVSTSKRKEIELPQPAENNSPHPHSEGGKSRPQPTNLSTPPVKTGQRPAERPTGSATRSALAPGQKESSEPPINQADDMVDPVFLELPFLPPSPGPAQDDEEAEQSETSDVDAWIDARLARGNVDESSVIDALRCTSMDPTLADKVLEHFLAGQAVPDNIPGIWTAYDDECLEGQNMRDVERVLTKHGSGACEARWDYLSMARERGLV